MLNLAVGLENRETGSIRHTYFKKKAKSPLAFHGRRACPRKQKILILAEEVRRRMTNQDKFHSRDERIQLLRKLVRR